MLHFLRGGYHIWLLFCFGSRTTAIHHRKQFCDFRRRAKQKLAANHLGHFVKGRGYPPACPWHLHNMQPSQIKAFPPPFEIKCKCGWCNVKLLFKGIFADRLANGCSLGNKGLINKVFWPHRFVGLLLKSPFLYLVLDSAWRNLTHLKRQALRSYEKLLICRRSS